MNQSPTALHIPDGFLNITVSIVFWLVTIIIVEVIVFKGENLITIKGH